MEELRRQASAATTYGLDLDLLGRDDVRRCPLVEVDDVLAAGWLPGDGYLEPGATSALAAGATALGVTVVTGVRVTGDPVGRPGRRA